MKPLLSALVILAHCGPNPTYDPKCVSKCGMILVEPVTPSWTCEAFQDTEDRALRAFRAYSKDARLWQCENKLAGYLVTERNVDDWKPMDYPGPVVGLTHCTARTIETNWMAPKAGSLTHEMAHALQKCETLPPENPDDPQHSNWLRDGIYEAITHEKEDP